MTDHRTIAVPYEPDQVVGEWGWLWLPETEEEGDGWVLVHTTDEYGKLYTEAQYPVSCRFKHSNISAHIAGTPYIPMHRPKCTAQAGAMVCVWLPGGGSITVTREDTGPRAQALTDAVLAVLREEGEG